MRPDVQDAGVSEHVAGHAAEDFHFDFDVIVHVCRFRFSAGGW
jgi:hypothetical protein